MKIPNIQELQQIAFNHSSDVDFRDFVNLYKKCTVKTYSFLVIDAPLHFWKNLLETIWNLVIKIDNKIRDEKLLHDTNREA